jgi:hypothetical protein
MQIRIECGLDSRSRAGVWPNDRAGVRAVRTIQGGKNELWIRFRCGLHSRIYGTSFPAPLGVLLACEPEGLLPDILNKGDTLTQSKTKWELQEQ